MCSGYFAVLELIGGYDMFILKALLYLVTLPLRIVGTVIALALKFIGIGLILLTTVCGMFTGILSGITMLCAVLGHGTCAYRSC